MKVSQKITDAVIASLPAEVKRVVDIEIRGLYLDVGAQKTDGSRRMSYYLYYRIGGRNGTERRYKIGEAALMTAGQARAEAKKLKSRVILNEDVFLTRKNEQRRAEHEEDTGPDIDLLADEFMRIYVANQRNKMELKYLDEMKLRHIERTSKYTGEKLDNYGEIFLIVEKSGAQWFVYGVVVIGWLCFYFGFTRWYMKVQSHADVSLSLEMKIKELTIKNLEQEIVLTKKYKKSRFVHRRF